MIIFLAGICIGYILRSILEQWEYNQRVDQQADEFISSWDEYEAYVQQLEEERKEY